MSMTPIIPPPPPPVLAVFLIVDLSRPATSTPDNLVEVLWRRKICTGWSSARPSYRVRARAVLAPTRAFREVHRVRLQRRQKKEGGTRRCPRARGTRLASLTTSRCSDRRL